jgi:outer membrane immunogenic protein
MRISNLMISVTVAISAIAGVGAASAADLPARTYTKAPVMIDPAYNWTGWYVGANVGGGWSNSTYLNTVSVAPFGSFLPGDSFNVDSSGVVGGGQIGYNYQVSSWVLGVEAKFDASDIKGGVFPIIPARVPDDNFTTRIRSIFMLTARVGYAFNNWLPYIKGGYAGAEVKSSVLDNNAAGGSPVGSGSASSWRSGGTVGAGIEYAFNRNWSAAVEYDYARLAKDSYNLGNATGPYTFDTQIKNLHLVTGSINYHFNSTVVAKY